MSLACAGSTTRLSPMPIAPSTRQRLQADLREPGGVVIEDRPEHDQHAPAARQVAIQRRDLRIGERLLRLGGDQHCALARRALGRRAWRPRGSGRRRAGSPRRTCRSRRRRSDSMSGSPCPCVKQMRRLLVAGDGEQRRHERRLALPGAQVAAGRAVHLGFHVVVDQIVAREELRPRARHEDHHALPHLVAPTPYFFCIASARAGSRSGR